jgi:UDP-glucuronate 4-epimerase
MSLLVTGGAGFIGTHFIEHVLKATDWPIVCLDNFNDYYDPARKRANAARSTSNSRVTLAELDFCQTDAVADLLEKHSISRVMHFGAYAGVRYSMDHPLPYQHANVYGTCSMLEAVRRHPVERFLLASSSTVYGNGATAPFVEDGLLGVPLSPYGASKRAAELLCQTYHLNYDIPTVSLRLFSVYGPGLRPDLAMTIFTDKIFSGKPMPLYGDGTIRRDFTHVHDVCSGLFAALTVDGVIGQAINLGHDEPIEIRRVIELLESEIGKKANIDQQPDSPGDMPLTQADISKAKRLLNYNPAMPFEVGVKEFVDWYRKVVLA